MVLKSSASAKQYAVRLLAAAGILLAAVVMGQYSRIGDRATAILAFSLALYFTLLWMVPYALLAMLHEVQHYFRQQWLLKQEELFENRRRQTLCVHELARYRGLMASWSRTAGIKDANTRADEILRQNGLTRKAVGKTYSYFLSRMMCLVMIEQGRTCHERCLLDTFASVVWRYAMSSADRASECGPRDAEERARLAIGKAALFIEIGQSHPVPD